AGQRLRQPVADLVVGVGDLARGGRAVGAHAGGGDPVEHVVGVGGVLAGGSPGGGDAGRVADRVPGHLVAQQCAAVVVAVAAREPAGPVVAAVGDQVVGGGIGRLGQPPGGVVGEGVLGRGGAGLPALRRERGRAVVGGEGGREAGAVGPGPGGD